MAAKLGRPFKERPSRDDLVRLYVKEKRSVRDVAAQLGCSKDIVYRALKEYGVKLRPSTGTGRRRSQLIRYPLKDLRAWIREQGIRGTARNLGIHENTLRHYLKGIEKEK